MAVDDLLRALEREAEAEAEDLRAAARADAAEVDRASLARVAARTGVALAEVRARKQAVADGAVAVAGRRRQADVLVHRAAALERVRAAVDARLAELLAGPGAAEVWAALVGGVLAALGEPGEPVTVRCPPAMVAEVRSRLGARPGVTVAGDAAVGPGLVADRADGRVTIDARLATFLDRWWPGLRLAVRPPS